MIFLEEVNLDPCTTRPINQSLTNVEGTQSSRVAICDIVQVSFLSRTSPGVPFSRYPMRRDRLAAFVPDAILYLIFANTL